MTVVDGRHSGVTLAGIQLRLVRLSAVPLRADGTVAAPYLPRPPVFATIGIIAEQSAVADRDYTRDQRERRA